MSFRIVVWAASLAACFCSSAAAEVPCSLETVRGVWVHTSTGTLMVTAPGSAQPAPVPVAMLGVYTIDEQGRMSGWSNGMVAGEYMDVTGAGRVEVNPDCTGTIRFTMTPQGAPGPVPGEGVARMVVVDDGNEIRAMTITGILGKSVGTETYRRMVRNSKALPKCTAETVRGTYAAMADGITLRPAPGQAQPVTVPISGISAVAVDGRGAVTGGGTSSIGGQAVEWEMADNSLRVLEDCTGYFTYRVKPKGAPAPQPGQALEKFVVLDDGDEIRVLDLLSQMGKPIAPGVWKRISKQAGTVSW